MIHIYRKSVTKWKRKSLVFVGLIKLAFKNMSVKCKLNFIS